MARKLRKTQEQLGFPELELPSAAPGPLAGTVGPFVGAAVEEAQSGSHQNEADSPKAPRRRSVKPKMVLVTEALAEPASVAVRPPLAIEVAAPVENAMPEPAPSRPADSPVEPSELPASSRDLPPVVPDAAPRSPAREAVAANEQFLAAPVSVPARAANPLAPTAIVASRPSAAELRLKIWAHVATISTALAIVAALFIASRQFIETENSQRALLAAQQATLLQERHIQAAEVNSRAVELFLRYNDLMQQLNGPVAKNAKKETRYWKENLAVNLLESLFNLTRGNREWETTIAWALEKHVRFIREQRLACTAYSHEFVRYLEKTLGARAAALCKEQASAD